MSNTNASPPRNEAEGLAGDVLHQVSKQVELSKARSDQRASANKSNNWAMLGVMLVPLTGIFLVSLPDPGPALTNAETRYSMLDEISELAYDIEEYREQYGVLPDTLELLGEPKAAAMTYLLLGQKRYRISFHNGHHTLVYESDDSTNIFFAEVRGVE